MVITLIAPEWVLGKAFADLVSAIANQHIMRNFAAEDDVPWTLSHAFFADMGGFVVLFPEDTQTEVRFSTEDSLCKYLYQIISVHSC